MPVWTEGYFTGDDFELALNEIKAAGATTSLNPKRRHITSVSPFALKSRRSLHWTTPGKSKNPLPKG